MHSRYFFKAGQHCFRHSVRAYLVVLMALLAACAGDPLSLRPPTATPTRQSIPTLFPTTSVPSVPPTNDPSMPSDSGWLAGSSDIELRRLQLPASADHAAASISIVRLDPSAIQLRVGYAPAQPQPLSAWFSAQQPLLIINGGFFTPEYRATALVVSNGEAHGTSYEGFGGMLAVTPDGKVSIRSLREQPYDSSEALTQAVQSFPMLVQSGGVPATIDEDGNRARRTVVAQDGEGRLLFVVCSTSSFSLRELAAWLASSDLQIEQALNLDGGRSTGMYLDAGALQERIEPFDVLPMVLFVEPRS